MGGLKRNRDRVTTPAGRDSAAAWRHNGLANGSLFPLVQFATAVPGIVAIGTGDSHHQGTSTTEQFSGFLYRTMTELGRRHFGRMPVGMVNCAAGGLTSEQFFPRLEDLLRATRPSFAVLPGWTYNDRSGGVRADATAVERFLARAIRSAEICGEHGVHPVFLTPFPRNRDAMTPIQLAPWNRLRQTLLAMGRAGATVIDATPLLGSAQDGAFDGTYAASRTVDGMHPDDRGHDAVAAVLTDAILASCEPAQEEGTARPPRTKRERRNASSLHA